jgi:redox-sensitive bicupin YhaK (pirin superfamily)
MTAGSGIIHQEMPQESPTGTMWGFQFWANLPASQKMMAPRYRDVKAADIPEVTLENGVTVKVIAGRVAGVQGPVGDIVIEPEMLDISVPAGTVFSHPLPAGHTAFTYILSGEGSFDDQHESHLPETVLLFEHTGETIQVTATDGTLRFLLISGKPLNEPIAWQGPIVMNTQEELRTAFEEYQRGTFVK